MSTPKRNKYTEHQLGAKEIERYMEKRDIPDWFRGISKFQCAAASGLLEALLYDGEQRSTHRIKACLASLGLKPMASNEQLKKLMKISRGSDLAFLWFLLESHYKSNGPGYSINEQIIYSCIAHLDMVTTLRELDRLLPHNPPEDREPSRSNKESVIIKPTTFKQFKIPKSYVSPYLEPIKSPVFHYRPIEMKRPIQMVSLAEYEVYRDPTYIVRNEANRWFATYKPKYSKRIVACILRDEIERILYNGDEIAKEIDEKFIVCSHHKSLIDAIIQRKYNLEERKRANLKCYFDLDGAARAQRTREEILAQIEREVKMLMQKLRYDTEKLHKENKEIKETNKRQKLEILEGIGTIRYCDPHAIIGGDQCKERDYEVTTIVDDEDIQEDNRRSIKNGWTSRVSVWPKIPLPSFCDILKTSKKHDCFFRGLCGTAARQKTAFDDGEQYFFRANQKHKPYCFDYRKIFNIGTSMPTTQEQRIQASILKVLNSQMTLSSGYMDIQRAFDEGFTRRWSKSVDEYNRTVHLESPSTRDNADENDNGQNEDDLYEEEEEENVPLSFDRDYFDPNDKPYMVYMLKCCFDRMKKNPKYVLAALPDAHKIPILLYFIQRRYGKRYSLEERQSIFAESLRILRALEKMTKEAPVPKIEEFANASRVSYGCRDYLLAKGEKFRQKYYDELDRIIMHEARIFWFSMRPYLRTSGPPRNTYFAYMPSSTVDLTRFRQWKPSEFMDAKKAWDRRQKLAKRY